MKKYRILVVKIEDMGYNTFKEKPEVFDNPAILNLQYFKRDS